ncbi:MAG TPA: aminomethyl-transferring glycine dehydrogenase subunit GcvPA [Clostridia bacterium]|jgi:glycine dehydrogenase subunit 1|nr:aminomethyl-transferring glycine dehydrogenase subunit GcvPA [Clostridia bacterium]
MVFVPHTPTEKKEMLAALGIAFIDDLFRDLPPKLRLSGELSLGPGFSEAETYKKLTALAEKNKTLDEVICFRGAGAYQHYQPHAVKQLMARSEFYTAYTPYQPEISQGTLQAIFEYQTSICELTGMDVANASHYDGATALAEAALLAVNVTRRKKIAASSLLHPEYQATLNTYLKRKGVEIIWLESKNGVTVLPEVNDELAAVLIASPNFLGCVEDFSPFASVIHQEGGLLIACVDPLSLGILESPGKMGADLVVGEGQSLGLPLNFGGPYLGFMACRQKYMRQLPGRIVGQTVDEQGRRGYVLTLQTREQHIRRERAGSNICSNQSLCALEATVYLALLGPQGLAEVAKQCLFKSHYAREQLSKIPGVRPVYSTPFFREFVVETSEHPLKINQRLWEKGILGGLPLGKYNSAWEHHLLVCVTEMRTKEEIDQLVQVWKGA